MTAHQGDATRGFVYLIILAALYFIPWILAAKRKHVNANAIGVLNLFLGWTFIGWVIALVWANTSNVKAEPPPAVSEKVEEPRGRTAAEKLDLFKD